MTAKELVEVAILHVFNDDTEGFVQRTDSDETNDIGVSQSSHDPYFLHEVRSDERKKRNQRSVDRKETRLSNWIDTRKPRHESQWLKKIRLFSQSQRQQ